MKYSIDELRPLAILAGLPDQLLQWLVDNSTRIGLKKQDLMFKRGEPADYMFIVVTGMVERFHEIDGQWLVMAATHPGEVTGMLPYSRMTHYPGNAIAHEPSQVMRIDKNDFAEMLAISHEFGQRLVAEMSNRVRRDIRFEQQWEKMASLGRLSAGLAHELNNPASAVRRASANLETRLVENTSLFIRLARHGLHGAAVNAVEELLTLVNQNRILERSPLERQEREEELNEWLSEQNVAEAWNLAGLYTMVGLNTEDLKRCAENIPADMHTEVFQWVAGQIELNRMATDINSASERISDLISSVKAYSDMDQFAGSKSTDVRTGINDTLKMFTYKLNQKNISVKKEYQEDLPSISANVGSLNQVWTYLIDNAIDAMVEHGELSVKISGNASGVEVKVIDNGIGIPEDIRDNIFDPFFTTKGVGEGTGLGLNISRRIIKSHRGQISVQSVPGRTEISVRLPFGLTDTQT